MPLRRLVALIVFVVCSGGAAALLGAPAARPNILFVLSDDHSYPFLSCYGDTNVRTPTLDRLAAEGMKFHRFFTVAPQCVPSRAGYLTGRSAVAARMTRFSSPLPRDEITFPELLREKAGYFTGICGRTYHLDGSARNASTAIGKFVEEQGLRTFAQRVDYLRQGSDTEAIAQMREFLDQKPREKPFCLWLNFSDPHHPWTPPASDRPDPASLKLPPHWPDVPGLREQLADYCGEVNRVDRSMKLVLDLLAERGFADNTLVVFAGDNGAALPHGKGSLYDPGANVPLVIRWPGVIRPGGESATLLSGEDIAPTLLAAAGLAPGPKMSGVNFIGLLKGEAYTPRKHVFVERGPHGTAPVTAAMRSSGYDLSRSVRSDRYKFIYNCTPWIPYSPVDSAGGAGWRDMTAANDQGKLSAGLRATYFSSPRPVYELYDLQADPSELNNLSGDAKLATVEQELRHALAEKMILDFDYLPLPALGDESAPAGKAGKGKGKKAK
ncbi:sulfatase family protein [Horticoccus sp. 23ND18S-11]|uniref:sulfatase family protein n=1 Tax=Horticoccus sp. 23ND18S-11 TaxID=3391832 RepID=UPI0039C91DD8